MLLTISAIGLLRQRHCKRSWLLIVGIASIFLFSWPPMDWLLSRPLEVWYTVRPLQSAQAQAIVVLSEGVHPADSDHPYALPDTETYERCEFAAWLHNHWRPLPVLACGGSARKGGQPFSLAMRDLLRQAGIPSSLIWTEERSHSTHENAVYGAEILRQRGITAIALVVEAKSMMRAAASF
ncbi:MAG TPA: YdcF family protein, partial [Bryobacteraceae bacterium]|nr:YdcF family protein [Bryobacteraceae bacterium]